MNEAALRLPASGYPRPGGVATPYGAGRMAEDLKRAEVATG
jgi:hypothetical protein